MKTIPNLSSPTPQDLPETKPVSNRWRIRKVSKNFFLHFHFSKIHPHSLKPTYTFGLGIIAAFLFLILIFTGVFLLIYYTPSVERAYSSVKDITIIVSGGRYVRNIHRWAAHGLVFVAFLHLLRVFYTGSYLHSRSFNWVVGNVMFLVVLLMSFSGYLLPWDQLAFWAITIGSNIAASVRDLTDLLGITTTMDIGGFIKSLLIGGETIAQPALTRLFMLHIIFLPLLMLVLTGLHIWRVRKDGGITRQEEAVPVSSENSDGESGRSDQPAKKLIFSWPVVMWGELALFMLTAAALMMVAFWIDAPLKEQANPAFPENPAKSPWYFLGIQELVSYSAFAGGVLIPLLFVIFLMCIPYVDKENRYIGIWFSGRVGKLTGIYSLVFSLVLTVLLVFVVVNFGWLRDWNTEVSQFVVLLVNPATIAALLYTAWSFVVYKKTSSTRMATIALFTCAVVGLVMFTLIGNWFRGPNWEFFWSPSQWPRL